MSIETNHFFKEKINIETWERQTEGEGYGAKWNDQLTLRLKQIFGFENNGQ